MSKKLCVVIIACLLLYDIVEGKKTKKNKRLKPDEEENVPQPDVVSYSTFGFNDVGTYEGFVPSSPDYTRFLTGANEESSTKQLPSSYPTSIDSTGYGNSFGPQSYDVQSGSVSNDGNSQPSFGQYQQNFNGFFNNPSIDTDIAQFKNAPTEEIFGTNKDELNAPVYGTKLSSKSKFGKFINQFNHTGFEQNSDKNEEKYNFNFNAGQQPSFENKPAQSELSFSSQNIPTYPATSGVDFGKTDSGDPQNPFKFPRVIDFTKMKQFYPTELDTSQFPSATPRPESYDISASAPSNNMFTNLFNDNSKPNNQGTGLKEIYDQKKNNDEDAEKNSVNSYTYSNKNNIYNFSSNTDDKPILHETKPSSENKKKMKNKPWSSGSYNFKKWKDPSPVKGYEYSTNFSNMSFKYGVDEPKKPFISGISSIEEVIPASSNIEFAKYQFPEMDYSKFKKIPSYKVHEDNEFDGFPSYKEISPFKEKQPEFNQHKHLFSPDSTASSYWGNSFKSTDFSSFKNHANKHKINDVTNDEVVNIQPKRPTKFNYGKPYESKPSEWSQFSRRPSKNRPWNDWTKEVSNKFKSEEDLLGLRNHDTSLPSYLPSYQSSNNYASEEQDYKKLVDKWRQSYLKSKYKETLRDYESYASEAKPMHVPVPKPYPIEVPHPIIVPVPQPFPVRVPVAKPVAVPVFREITIPIEKPVPYPVYKKVPYPIEKLVPVPVEKEVAVPVVKPYPVHVPYIRPVFHHTKSRDEYDSDVKDDDDYFPRQESNKKQVQYRKKKPAYSSTRERPLERPRRPSRTVYHDRNRRRWPDRRRPLPSNEMHLRRPSHKPLSSKHRDFDEGYDEDRAEYFLYCKKTGNC